VVKANLQACEAPKEACGRVVNVACGVRVSLLDILEVVYNLAGRRVPPRFEPSRPGDVRDSLADIALAKVFLGYEPHVGFPEGLSRTFDFFRNAIRSGTGGS
jgi:UDP-N-acetylglucosamine 4-epimerase